MAKLYMQRISRRHCMYMTQYPLNHHTWTQQAGGTTTGDTGECMRRSTAKPSGASCSLVAPGTGCTRGTLQHEQRCVSTLLGPRFVRGRHAFAPGTCLLSSGM